MRFPLLKNAVDFAPKSDEACGLILGGNFWKNLWKKTDPVIFNKRTCMYIDVLAVSRRRSLLNKGRWLHCTAKAYNSSNNNDLDNNYNEYITMKIVPITTNKIIKTTT